jgi:hypothetical protein
MVNQSFTTLEKAKAYVKELGYSLKDSHQFKEDRSFIFKHKHSKKHLYLRSTWDYLDSTTTDMGTVWVLQKI